MHELLHRELLQVLLIGQAPAGFVARAPQISRTAAPQRKSLFIRVSLSWKNASFASTDVRAEQPPQIKPRPQDQRERELERQVEEMLAEAPEVAGEGAVVGQAPVAELGGVDEFHVEEEQEDVEEDRDQ